MMQQRVRELRDREDEDEIEEQLGVGDAAVPIRRDDTKQRAAWIFRRHAPRCLRRRRVRPGTPVCSASACSTPPIWPFSD